MNVPATLRWLTAHLVAALIALVVIGGATRVMEAGLACPDWPLCYGNFFPGRQMNLQVFLEWFHRLDAFLVGVVLLVLLALGLWKRTCLPPWFPWMVGLSVGLVGLQGGLGALTVTGLLASPTVTAHLGTALLLILIVSGIDQGLDIKSSLPPLPMWWFISLILTTVLVFFQCLLGGAMASQWAVDHCFTSGEQCAWLLRHRQLALPAGVSVVCLATIGFMVPGWDSRLRGLAFSAAMLVVIQVSLGILTLRAQLQFPSLTIAHQFVAALLTAHLGAIWGRTLLCRQRSKFPSLEVSCG